MELDLFPGGKTVFVDIPTLELARNITMCSLIPSRLSSVKGCYMCIYSVGMHRFFTSLDTFEIPYLVYLSRNLNKFDIKYQSYL